MNCFEQKMFSNPFLSTQTPIQKSSSKLFSQDTLRTKLKLTFRSNPDEDAVIRDTVNEMATFLPTRVIEMGDRAFSRGQALTAGASTLSPDSLLFFTDVDMLFTYETLQRIRLNTVMGAQVSHETKITKEWFEFVGLFSYSVQ